MNVRQIYKYIQQQKTGTVRQVTREVKGEVRKNRGDYEENDKGRKILMGKGSHH